MTRWLLSKMPPPADYRRTIGGSPSQVIPPNGAYITLEASTPTPPLSTRAHHEVDSPLRNPRPPPEPPIVAVIPPTPARELDMERSSGEQSRGRLASP